MTTKIFNLTAPPGFRGLDPHIPVTAYRRHLPHLRQDGATYFVTFRLADALPQHKLEELKRWRRKWEQKNPEPRSEQQWEEFARQLFLLSERWMDEGYGECVFADLRIAKNMMDAFLYFQDDRYTTFSYTVMPNHCHVVVKPLSSWALEKILDSWKGFVGHSVNQELGRTGVLWQEESYDRIIRDEEHLFRVIQYIGNNPRQAGLPEEAWVRWIHPDWEKLGWGFRDT
jgi:REP element-mobilizing transposase RayT